MARGNIYLTAIIDVLSRYVVGRDVINSLDAENSLEVMKRSLAIHGKPSINSNNNTIRNI